MGKYRLLTFILIIATLTAIPRANALNSQNLYPSTGSHKGYQLFTSDQLPQKNWAFGFGINWAKNPIESGQNVGNRNGGLVDDLITGNLMLSVGFTDWLQVDGNLPVNFYHNIAPLLIANRDKGGAELGDVKFNVRLKIFDANKNEDISS